MNDNPLVSILLIAYNSSKFVLEALESCKNQTYRNIELIVSDDCSTDNTVEICRRWIDDNGERFPQVQLLTVEKNTGIVPNCNRAFAAAHGSWIKWFAGDDVLPAESIERYVDYITHHPDAKFCVAHDIHFVDLNDKKGFRYLRLTPSRVMFGKHATARRQFFIEKHIFLGSGPTNFFNTEAFKNLGGYDDRFPLQEDHAFYIKMMKNGYKLHLIDDYLVLRRINPDSVCHQGSEGKFFSPQKVRYIQEYKYRYCTENMGPIGRLMMKYSLWVKNAVIKNGNSATSKRACFYYRLYMITDPFVNFERALKLIDRL